MLPLFFVPGKPASAVGPTAPAAQPAPPRRCELPGDPATEGWMDDEFPAVLPIHLASSRRSKPAGDDRINTPFGWE